MNPQEKQVVARDDKWVPFSRRVKISSTNIILETIAPQKEETFQVVIDLIKNSTCFKAFTILVDVLEIYMQQFWYSIKKVQGTNSYEFLFTNKKCTVNAKVFMAILDICQRVEDWEIYIEGSRTYWKIIRVGGITEAYQSFEDMLKGFDREDLVALWNLRHWIELFSNYDCEIRYHPSNANVVVDALMAQKEAFDESTRLQRGIDEMIELRSDRSLYYLDRIWVPLNGDVRNLIIDEAHKSKYFVHLGADKMYYDLRDRPSGLLQQLEISKWKWERIAMDFKGVVPFGKKEKLVPRFVGPLEITKQIDLVAYRLRLPEELNGVHDTFHVLNLKKCLADPTLQVPLDEIQVDAKLNFVEEPMEILEREFKKFKRSRIAIVMVRWNSKRRP
nr:reverse transcriptase domain-containing protein [Tanacetum cinerariifolium]